MSKILEPISSNSAVGEDYKYEDTYTAIQNEIDKIQNITGSLKTDWVIVKENSKEILENHSKDLKLLSYWIYAHWKLDKWSGLLEALPIFIKVIDIFKNSAYPKKTRAKIKLLEWLRDNLLSEILANAKSTPKGTVDKLENLLQELDKILPIALENSSPPRFSSIVRKLKEEIANQKREEPKKKKKIEKKIEKKEDKPAIKKIDVQKYNNIPLLEEIKCTINRVATEEKETNSIIHLELLQSIGFIELENILNSNQKIDISLFPKKESRDKLESSFKKTKTKELLFELKTELLNYPCWIEGYFFIILIYESLGSKDNYKKIKYNLSYFIQSNNKLLTKQSPVDYAIITPEIQKWIKNFSTNSSVEYTQKYSEASALAKKGKRKEAISFLDLLYNKSNTGEESFLWRLKQIDMAIETREIQMAIALLYDLENRIDKYHLDEWNPSLSIEVYKLFLKPILARELTLEKKEAIYRKLCIISAQSAIKIGIN
ncbi:Uncharacterized protein ImpA [hydrothermal vent metagenome]|uniref:Uncharacterized protein ImpA n=1 Tax=hydrothermal vent metagenome TaxID=652676 RepID=A0A1W1BCN7_9ZZZZ